MRKKKSKSFGKKDTPIFPKRKIKVIIDEHVALNVIEPSQTSPGSHPFPLVSLGQQAPTYPVTYSRKEKCVIKDLTTDVERAALYRGLTLEKLDHYVSHLPYMEYERQLDAIYEGVDAEVVHSHLIY